MVLSGSIGFMPADPRPVSAPVFMAPCPRFFKCLLVSGHSCQQQATSHAGAVEAGWRESSSYAARKVGGGPAARQHACRWASCSKEQGMSGKPWDALHMTLFLHEASAWSKGLVSHLRLWIWHGWLRQAMRVNHLPQWHVRSHDGYNTCCHWSCF